MKQGINLADRLIEFSMFDPAVPASASPRYVNLRGMLSFMVVITGQNTTGPTPPAVTLNQAQDVSGTNAKALAFTSYKSNTSPATNSVFTNSTASNNTFTPTNTANAVFKYEIPVDPRSLDFTNGFNYVNVGLTNATNCTVEVHALAEHSYLGRSDDLPNVAVN